jgi:hypothetical protein
MQLTRTPIVIQPVRRIARLLHLKDRNSGPDRVDGTRVHKHHVTLGNGQMLQQILSSAISNRRAQRFDRDTRLQTASHRRTRLSLQHIPAFGLAAANTQCRRFFVIRMHLHRQLRIRKQQLHQQRKLSIRSHRPKQLFGMSLRNRTQCLALVNPVVHHASRPGQPRLTNRITRLHRLLNQRRRRRIPGRKVVAAPGAALKLGMKTERRKRAHALYCASSTRRISSRRQQL